MKVLIFGASGAGTTTLGKAIEKRTDFIHLDVDDYYWQKTDPPFQEKVPLAERNKNLEVDFKKYENVVVSGSLVNWGKAWQTAFNLAIFICLDDTLRIERLEKREIARFGKQLQTNPIIRETSKAFFEWAKQYENPNFTGRSLKIHNDWIKLLDCKVVRIDGAMELEIKVEKVLEEMRA